jgi:transposase
VDAGRRLRSEPRSRACSVHDQAQPDLPCVEHPGPVGEFYVLHTGIHWQYQPQGLGLGSATRCWRRLRDWNEAGVWQRLHPLPKAPPMPVARCGPSGGAVGFR